MTMHVNMVYRVTTINRVAQNLGADEDLLSGVASEMDAEDGRLWVYGVGEDGIMGVYRLWDRDLDGVQDPQGEPSSAQTPRLEHGCGPPPDGCARFSWS